MGGRFDPAHKDVDHGRYVRISGIIAREIRALTQHPGIKGVLKSVEGAFNVQLAPDDTRLRTGWITSAIIVCIDFGNICASARKARAMPFFFSIWE